MGHTHGVLIPPNPAIRGMMIESNVEAGSQPFAYGETRKEDLNPYISITDACIGWDETEALIRSAHQQLSSS
jgi:3-deoxy-7-phosphoheptulonate synthase